MQGPRPPVGGAGGSQAARGWLPAGLQSLFSFLGAKLSWTPKSTPWSAQLPHLLQGLPASSQPPSRTAKELTATCPAAALPAPCLPPHPPHRASGLVRLTCLCRAPHQHRWPMSVPPEKAGEGGQRLPSCWRLSPWASRGHVIFVKYICKTHLLIFCICLSTVKI